MGKRASADNRIGVSVGASKESVAEARAALNDILLSSNAESVKIAAMETLRQLCKVENTTITNCTINTGDML